MLLIDNFISCRTIYFICMCQYSSRRAFQISEGFTVVPRTMSNVCVRGMRRFEVAAQSSQKKAKLLEGLFDIPTYHFTNKHNRMKWYKTLYAD